LCSAADPEDEHANCDGEHDELEGEADCVLEAALKPGVADGESSSCPRSSPPARMVSCALELGYVDAAAAARGAPAHCPVSPQ